MFQIRSFERADLPALIDLTIDSFGPFYEDTFRSMVGDVIFTHQHGRWADDYRRDVPGYHDPEHGRHVRVAVDGDAIVGFVGWHIEPEKRHGEIDIVAVARGHRRSGIGRTICEFAIAELKDAGAEVIAIGTGGDEFHAPARALYEALGFTSIPVAVYFKAV
jgi:ribosomal protein S18 acetylase RimI-like enzyme